MRGAHIANKSDYLESKLGGSCVHCGTLVKLSLVPGGNTDYLEGPCDSCGYDNWFPLQTLDMVDKL